MPLKSGSTKKTISANIKELVKSKPSKPRKRAILTLAKKRGITPKKAQQVQAVAIAFSKARQSRRGKK